MRKNLSAQPASSEVPAWRPSVEEILEVVGTCFGVETAAMPARGRHGNEARAAAVDLCRRLTDESVSSLAERFGGVSAAAITKAVTRSDARRLTDCRWARPLTRLEERLKADQHGK